MKRILYTLLLICIANATMTSCSDSDEQYGKIYLNDSGLYVEGYGESASTTFETKYLNNLYVNSTPDGWSAEISLSDATVTVTAPLATDSYIETEGVVYLKGEYGDGSTVSASINVGIVDYVDLDSVRANCMIVDTPNKFYTFTPIKGEDESQRVVAEDYVLLWRTTGKPINHLRILDDGRVGFYASKDVSDLDEDGDVEDLIDGNAVIAARDSDYNTIWAWHIWVTDRAITTTNINGVEFMDLNIGAFDNSDATHDDIQNSHGLYYQWGRKDPFINPLTYDAEKSYNDNIYNTSGGTVTYKIENSDETIGTVEYGIQNPLSFIVGVKESNYDWLYAGNHDDNLWGGTTKSIYDPSPKGWRIPTSAEISALSGLTVTAGDYAADFGGNLFMASGLRAYIDGSIHNLSSDGSYAPWSGYYWSSDASATADQSAALQFYLNTADKSVTVDTDYSSYRANAMQIRPVKE